MNTLNPYESPASSAPSGGKAPMRRRPPIVLSCLLLFVGVFFLLLLNGQVFTNSLVFLGVSVLSLLLWIRALLPSPRNAHRRLAFYFVLGHAVVMIACAVGLPQKYRQQKNFNTMTERVLDRCPPTPGLD